MGNIEQCLITQRRDQGQANRKIERDHDTLLNNGDVRCWEWLFWCHDFAFFAGRILRGGATGFVGLFSLSRLSGVVPGFGLPPMIAHPFYRCITLIDIKNNNNAAMAATKPPNV
jgi:hypothetical protein